MDIRTIKVALSIKEKMLENLHIIKELQNNDFKEKIEKLTNQTFSNPTDFIKYKILNFIKNTKYIANIIENDNTYFMNIIGSQSDLHVRDKILEKLIISSQKSNKDNLKLESKNDIQYIIKKIINEKEYSTELINPFNGIKTSFQSFNTNKNNPSTMVLNHSALKQKEFDRSFKVVINKKSCEDLNFNIFEEEKEKNLILEFTIFHELAHASYSQIVDFNNNDNKKEKNADMVSALKVIKNNDFNINETKDFFSLLLKIRSEKANLNIYNILNNYTSITRDHFTEESLLNLKNFLLDDNNLDYIKSIKDAELSTFCEILENHTIKLDEHTEKVYEINKKEIIIKTILEDSDFFKTIKSDYDKAHAFNIKKYSSSTYNQIKKDYPATKDYIDKINRKIINQCMNNKECFNDLFIMHQLRTNCDNYIKNREKPLDPNISNNIKDEFLMYQKNKSNIDLNIDNTTTVRQLSRKLKNI